MVEKTLIIQQYYHHHIPLVTLCGKSVKQSQTVRGGRFESSFLTWPGKPNTHIWGTTPPTWLFPFLLVSRYILTALDYRIYRLCTHALARWYQSKDGGEVCPTPQSNQVLKLTDYHISRHVVSTFKRLTKLLLTAIISHSDCQLLRNKLSSCTIFHRYFICF